jgi:hypothetical protein
VANPSAVADLNGDAIGKYVELISENPHLQGENPFI